MTAEKDTPRPRFGSCFPDGQSWASDSGQGTVVVVIGNRRGTMPSVDSPGFGYPEGLAAVSSHGHAPSSVGIEDLTELLSCRPIGMPGFAGCPS